MRKVFILFTLTFVIALLTQSFQCSSPEMTTAKIAINNKDWEKAQTYLDKEIAKNPSNGEAWFYLAQVKQANNNVKGAADALLEADKYVVDPKLKDQIVNFKSVLWVQCYNNGIEALNQGIGANNKKLYETAALLFKTGSTLKPEMSDFYQLLGTTYDAAGDTANTIQYYTKYTEALAPELNLAKEKKVYLAMERKDALNILGSPATSKGHRFNPKSDSLIIDFVKSGDKEIYLYSSDKQRDLNFKLTGWRVNPPKSWMQSEKEQPQQFSVSAFSTMAQIYYSKKQYDKAVNSVMNILAFEPTNSDANNFIVSVYEEQGKKDEAYSYISNLVKADPKNKFYRTSYADILLKNNKYDEAIQQYEEVLKLDPKFEDVFVNLAIAYKNKVYTIQKRQQDEMDKDPKKTANPDEYIPLLKTASEYFEKARKLPRFSRSTQILAELSEVYYVTNEMDKLKVIVAELEAFEAIVPDEEKEMYYLKLVKIYDKWIRNADKLKQVQDKLNALNK